MAIESRVADRYLSANEEIPLFPSFWRAAEKRLKSLPNIHFEVDYRKNTVVISYDSNMPVFRLVLEPGWRGVQPNWGHGVVIHHLALDQDYKVFGGRDMMAVVGKVCQYLQQQWKKINALASNQMLAEQVDNRRLNFLAKKIYDKLYTQWSTWDPKIETMLGELIAARYDPNKIKNLKKTIDVRRIIRNMPRLYPEYDLHERIPVSEWAD